MTPAGSTVRSMVRALLWAGLMSVAARSVSVQGAEELRLRVTFGQVSEGRSKVEVGLIPGAAGVVVEEVRGRDLEAGESVGTGVGFTAGNGDHDSVEALVRWTPPTAPARQPHEIWRYLLEHGEAGQVRRLRDDPGLQPGAPTVTITTRPDGTRGFTVGLEQLRRHRALWLPEQDAFVTLAEAPVDWAEHRRSLRGERVLDAVARAPEASLDEWRQRWEDIGDPVRWNVPWETTWMGLRGHLTGLVAVHGALHKFGIDRWGAVRPDFASPHRFRLDLPWTGATWRGQRVVEGGPFLVTSLERDGQRCEIEQFAAAQEPGRGVAGSEPQAVLFSVLRWTGGEGPLQHEIRFNLEDADARPETVLRDGRWLVRDARDGRVWLIVEPGRDVQLRPDAVGLNLKGGEVALQVQGGLRAGRSASLVIKLPSPPLREDAVNVVARWDAARARRTAERYWAEWLERGALFTAPEAAVNDLFRANLWHALVLPRHRVDEQGRRRIDLPYSNFAYGQLNADWPINQAVYVDTMIHGLRGYDDVAEEEFAAMFATQQRADGRIGGYAEWGVYSPSMLYAIGRNYLLSRDRASLERLLPVALRAADWCLGQVTRRDASSGAPGLVVAPLNDLTHAAQAWGFPNAYFVAGLEVFGRALEVHGHPRAGELQDAARRMRADVTREFARASVRSPVVQLADGTWINYVPGDALTPRRMLEEWYPTDVDCGPLHLARLAAIDPRGWLAEAMLHDHEDNLFLNQAGMANEPVYNQQATVYLYRDQPEAAIRAFYSMIACAFSHHQLTPLEHRWAWGQYYMPPSTDGAWFELYRNLLINELQGDGTLFVGQAVPRAWWHAGKEVRVDGAPTEFGPVNVRLVSEADRGRLRATVEFHATDRLPQSLWVRLRHPDRAPIKLVRVNGREAAVEADGETVRIGNPDRSVFRIVAKY